MLDIRVIPITRHWICGERQISLVLLRAQFLMLLSKRLPFVSNRDFYSNIWS